MTPHEEERLRSLDRLAWILDEAIRVPGTRYRIGLDGLVGLIPGVGDIAGAALSGYIIAQAARLGAPPSLVARMGLNVVLEAVVGIVPLLGDLFDFGFKANARNVRLLRRQLSRQGWNHQRNRLVVGVAALLIIGFIVAIVVLTIAVLRWAWSVAIRGS